MELLVNDFYTVVEVICEREEIQWEEAEKLVKRGIKLNPYYIEDFLEQIEIQ